MAELFMSRLEMKLKCEGKLPRVYYRYVDDIFAVVKESEIDLFLNVFNSQCDSIKFTCEKENNFVLNFLDLQLTRNQQKLDFGVYHKPTSTKRVITSDSYCPIQHKHAAFHSLVHRLVNLPLSVGSFVKEYNYILDVANLNGYSKALIDHLINKHTRKRAQNLDTTLYQQNNGTLSENIREVFCYVPDVMSKIKNRLKEHKITPVYSNIHKIRNRFASTKDKISDNLKSGVYAVVCNVCKRRYIGQTKRSLAMRYKEHCACAKKKNLRESAFAKHVVENQHGTEESEHSIELIKCVNRESKLDAYESYYIAKETAPLNVEGGNINSCLFTLI